MIDEILKQHEGKTLEFKENLQSLQSVIKAIIAFANTAGGTIIIGIEDATKKIVGVADVLKEEERLASAIHELIVPLFMPDIQIKSHDGKALLIINVPHSAGPYYFKSLGLERGTYVRLGSTNRIADAEKLHALKNFARNIFFDEIPNIHSKIDDIDWEIVQKLFRQVDKKINPPQAETLGLLTKYDSQVFPSNGALLLFGKNHLTLFPDAIIRCARFWGDERNEIIDQMDIDIYLPLALDEAIKFVKKNSRLSSEFSGLSRRKDIPQYPAIAIREAIMNAILHADYSVRGVYISIAIFDERIEITNPGGLPFGFTIEEALTGYSRIRNRVIAKVFQQLEWIEQWGRGIGRIISACDQHGLIPPMFEELNDQFRVTIYGYKQRKQKPKPRTESTSWKKKITEHIKKHKSMSTKEAAQLWSVTSRTARSRLIKLVEAGILAKTGTSPQDPYGVYVLKKIK